MAQMHKVLPAAMDWMTRKTMINPQMTDQPLGPQREGMYAASGEGFAHGNIDRDHMVRTHSLYNAASRHPYVALATATLGIAALAAAVGAVVHHQPSNNTESARRFANKSLSRARVKLKACK